MPLGFDVGRHQSSQDGLIKHVLEAPLRETERTRNRRDGVGGMMCHFSMQRAETSRELLVLQLSAPSDILHLVLCLSTCYVVMVLVTL